MASQKPAGLLRAVVSMIAFIVAEKRAFAFCTALAVFLYLQVHPPPAEPAPGRYPALGLLLVYGPTHNLPFPLGTLWLYLIVPALVGLGAWFVIHALVKWVGQQWNTP
jgi:hypothetical protein